MALIYSVLLAEPESVSSHPASLPCERDIESQRIESFHHGQLTRWEITAIATAVTRLVLLNLTY